MSKFAAIEARATQYPASTNDVVWLVERVRELRNALRLAQRSLPSVDEPWALFRAGLAEETALHRAIHNALAALDEPNLPVETH